MDNNTDTQDIKSMTLEEITDNFKNNSQKSYRASQVYSWLVKNISSFEKMTNIPKELRTYLKNHFFIPQTKIKNKQISVDKTIKYLIELYDGDYVEAVLMSYNHGYSVCISTQVGCKMGCAFCATGKSGFTRNLMPSEMISQIQLIQDDNNIRISNVVLMGMGEPLDNYENVLRFLKLISSENHMNIGMRHISLSTCGMVDKIYELSKQKMQLTLSVSLHAPNDDIRNKIVKINRKWNIDKLLEACRFYISNTGRRISFEYAMIDGINDTPECAFQLASLLKNMICHLNLIPLNKSDDSSLLRQSSNNQIYKFKNILESQGINVTIRRTLGKDIDAACGQLRRRYVH